MMKAGGKCLAWEAEVCSGRMVRCPWALGQPVLVYVL